MIIFLLVQVMLDFNHNPIIQDLRRILFILTVFQWTNYAHPYFKFIGAGQFLMSSRTPYLNQENQLFITNKVSKTKHELQFHFSVCSCTDIEPL